MAEEKENQKVEFLAKINEQNGTMRVTIPKYLGEALNLHTDDLVKLSVMKVIVEDRKLE